MCLCYICVCGVFGFVVHNRCVVVFASDVFIFVISLRCIILVQQWRVLLHRLCVYGVIVLMSVMCLYL